VSESASNQTVRVGEMDLHVEIRGEGEPLLLLHGASGAAVNWRLIFPEAPAGFRSIAPDLRGHGRSANPRPDFTFAQLARDVLGLLDVLGVERCRAIGLSLGAKTLLHVATEQPERVEAMVLVSAAPRFPPQAREAMDALTPESRSEEEWRQMRLWHAGGDAQIRKLWSSLRALKDHKGDLEFTPAKLATIVARTLIVHGDRDPLYPLELAIELFQGIPGASLWVVPEGGHGPVFGTTAPQFAEVALRFLRGGRAADGRRASEA